MLFQVKIILNFINKRSSLVFTF